MTRTIAAAVLALGLAAASNAAHAQRNCDNAPAAQKAQCEARNKAEAKCDKMKSSADRRKCMYDELPPDCAKAENKGRCETEVAAHKGCRSKSGDEYKGCMMEKMGRK
jgi:hypothetical protein